MIQSLRTVRNGEYVDTEQSKVDIYGNVDGEGNLSTTKNPNNTEFDKLRFAQTGVNPTSVVEHATASGISKAIKHKIEKGVMTLFGIHDNEANGAPTGTGLNGELNADATMAAKAMGLGAAAASGALGGSGRGHDSGENFSIGVGQNGFLTVGGQGIAGQAGAAGGAGSNSASGRVGDPTNNPVFSLGGSALHNAQNAAKMSNLAAGSGGAGAWVGENASMGAGYGVAGRLGVGTGQYGSAGGNGGMAGAMGAGKGAVSFIIYYNYYYYY
jgi:hypothetical protein